MKLATINEAAVMLVKSPQQLRRGVDAGRYPFIQVGTRKLVDVDELREIVNHEAATIGIEEASELTGLPVSAIRRGIREGWIPCERPGKAYAIKPGELLESLQRMKQQK